MSPHTQVPGAPARYIAPSARLGRFSAVWWWSVVQDGVVIGDGCNIGSHCEIGRGSVIGDQTRIGAFTFLPPNTRLGARVFVGPHVMLCDDRHPYVHGPNDAPYTPEPPVVGDDAVLGAGCVVLPGVTIGAGARIAAGAVVTRDVPPGGVVRGEPARAHALSAMAAEHWMGPHT